MSQSFAFDFSADDDDEEDGEPAQDILMSEQSETGKVAINNLIAPQHHSFDEILASLPSSLSYGFTSEPVRIPRRELFDIRAQLMTEADPSREAAAGLNADDIEPGVYEGGFKTWECAVDLARFMLVAIESGQLSISGRDVHIIELGAGTALPSGALLHQLLALPPHSNMSNPPAILVTAADYNASVLSLATGPNLFLTSLSALDLLVPDAANSTPDLEPSPALLAALRSALQRRNVSINFLSGQWGEDFVREAQRGSPQAHHHALGDSQGRGRPLMLILASETIYQPTALPAFVDTVLALLRDAQAHGAEARAYVAAKRVYFGVGGGVEEFRRELYAKGGTLRECWASEGSANGAQGVRRCILEVSG